MRNLFILKEGQSQGNKLTEDYHILSQGNGDLTVEIDEGKKIVFSTSLDKPLIIRSRKCTQFIGIPKCSVQPTICGIIKKMDLKFSIIHAKLATLHLQFIEHWGFKASRLGLKMILLVLIFYLQILFQKEQVNKEKVHIST